MSATRADGEMSPMADAGRYRPEGEEDASWFPALFVPTAIAFTGAGAYVAILSVAVVLAALFLVYERARRRERRILEKSEERFRSLVQEGTDVITILDADGTVRYASPSVESVIGRKAEEIVGRKLSEILSPEEDSQAREMLGKVLRKSGEKINAEISVRHANGSRRYLDMIAVNMIDHPGIGGILVNTRDITRKKESEEASREVGAKYRALIEHTPVITYTEIVGESSASAYVSPQIESILGYAPDEFDGLFWRAILHPGDCERVLAEDERVNQTGEPFDMEYRVIAKDGRILWVRDESVLLSRDDDGTMRWQGVMSDITDRKRAEEDLRASESELRALLEAMSDAIFVIDRDGRHLKVAPTNPALLYRPSDEIVGRTLHEILPKEQADEYLYNVRRALATGEKVEMEYSLRLDSGLSWFEAAISPMREDAVVVVARDVTQRKGDEEALRESEERYQMVSRATNDVIWEVDLTTNQLTWVGAVETMFGYSLGEARIGEWWESRVHPEDRERVMAGMDRVLDGHDDVWSDEYRFRCGDGSYATVVDRAFVIRDSEGKALRMAGSMMDITSRRETEKQYRTLIERMPAVTYVQEIGNLDDAVYVSPQIETLTGHTPADFEAEPDLWYSVVHPDDRERVLAEDERTDETGEPFAMEYRLVHRDGREVWVRNEAVLIEDKAKGSRFWQGFIVDITERKELESQLTYQAFHDALTGLPNRVLFMDRLHHALARADRSKQSVGMLFMDLDNFKVVNDSLGHETGDKLLVEVSGRLRKCLRSEDTVARLGGDEFVILLEDVAGVNEAVAVAERIARELRAPFFVEGRELFVSTSIGITMSLDGQRGEELLRDADLALYGAKKKGRDEYEIFNASMNAAAHVRLQMENDLRRAVERGEFRLFYQPKVALESSAVAGYEALVRWDHPERGMTSPGEFIPLAEETGLIVPIGRWVLREACRQAREWQDRYEVDPPPMMSVNLSARQYQAPGLVEDVSRALSESGLDPRSLLLEITESVIMDDAAGTISTLNRLRALGVRLAIDDFGTGYSSLSYLKRFPVDFLKIDRSFIERLGEDAEAATIVAAMIGLAQDLGLEVIAEGVETPGQLIHLRGLDCDLAQGYYFARPLESEDASEFLLTHYSRLMNEL